MQTAVILLPRATKNTYFSQAAHGVLSAIFHCHSRLYRSIRCHVATHPDFEGKTDFLKVGHTRKVEGRGLYCWP